MNWQLYDDVKGDSLKFGIYILEYWVGFRFKILVLLFGLRIDLVH